MRIQRNLFLVAYLPALAVLSKSMLWADSWTAKAVTWSRAYARASVTSTEMIDDSGVNLFQQSNAMASAADANGSAQASAMTRGFWGGGTVFDTASGAASAGFPNPFVNRPSIQPGPGFANLDFEGVLTSPGIFTITGTASFNSNGFLELSVLDWTGLSMTNVSQIFLQFGSVESALAAGLISDGRVLERLRETSPLLESGSFAFDVPIGSLAPENVVFLGLGDAESVPEARSIYLTGFGFLLLLSYPLARNRVRA
jgi:hypothetical protein